MKRLNPSGLCMYNTASLTFSNSTFCPHGVFMCFVWIWEQTTIISPYNVEWLVFKRYLRSQNTPYVQTRPFVRTTVSETKTLVGFPCNAVQQLPFNKRPHFIQQRKRISTRPSRISGAKWASFMTDSRHIDSLASPQRISNIGLLFYTVLLRFG